MRFLITEAHHRHSLAILRSLSRVGRVDVASPRRFFPARFSFRRSSWIYYSHLEELFRIF